MDNTQVIIKIEPLLSNRQGCDDNETKPNCDRLPIWNCITEPECAPTTLPLRHSDIDFYFY
jgi:hypothetical protein